MKKRRIILFFMVAVLMMLTGCEDKEKDPGDTSVTEKKIQIGLSFDSFVIERWQRDRDVFVSTAQELGAEVNVQNANGDVEQQISQLEYLIKKRVDAIVIIAVDSEACSEVLQKAKEAGIIVIAYDRLVRNADVNLYISFDNEKVGRFMAETLVSEVPKGGNIITIFGPTTDHNVSLVEQGFNAIINEADLNIVYSVYAKEWLAEEAYNAVNAALVDHPEIDGVMAFAIVVLFFVIYFISVRSALASYRDFCIEKKLKNNRDSLNGLLGKAFPIFGLAPTVGLIVFFVIVPLMFSALVAFTNYSAPKHIPPNNTVDWVGFDNFVAMFGGNATWTTALARVALWTLVWAVLATATCYFGGLLMAVVLLDNKLKIAPFFRGIFILPYAVPSVVSMLIWQNLLNGSFGTVNRTLIQLGIIDKAIPWLSNEWFAKFTVVMINLWAGFPYFMLLITGTMTAISQDLFEAAKIDGAGKVQLFRKITLPLVLYQTMPLIIMSFTHNINNFGAIFFLSGGDPVVADSTVTSAGGTDLLVTWIYKLTINLMRYNYASVLAIMIFVILAPFAIFQFRRTKSYKEGEL